jgi:CheY-like chemotaxis protein
MPLRKSTPATHARILLVDDNTHGLAARKNVLQELGHQTVTAGSGVEALECVASDKFNLVVTDYKMPRMNGLELIARLRKQSPGLPVILISGFVDTLGLNEQNTGADVVIQKSNHEVPHLVRAVARLLNRKPARKPAAGEARAAKAKKKSS